MPSNKPSDKKSTLKPATLDTTPALSDAEVLQTFKDPNTIQAYRDLYDALGRAYWEASDIKDKDTIQGIRDHIYEILTDLNIEKLQANTELFFALKSKIEDNNDALGDIKKKIAKITKNLSTVASVISAISKVLSLAPSLL
jgi:hypothetical protein